MPTTSERRVRYDEVRADADEWLGDYLRDDLAAWASGEIARGYFGDHADVLDALCLLAVYEKQLPFVLSMQVQDAIAEGASWNAIAAALGVSRQAARKRFS